LKISKKLQKKLAIEKEFFYIHSHVMRSTLVRNLLLAPAYKNAATGHFKTAFDEFCLIAALNRAGRRSPTFFKVITIKERRVSIGGFDWHPVLLFSDLAARAYPIQF
jgi:hypothetical protein